MATQITAERVAEIDQINLVKVEVRAPVKGIYEVWCWYDQGGLRNILSIGHGETVRDAILNAGNMMIPPERLPGF